MIKVSISFLESFVPMLFGSRSGGIFVQSSLNHEVVRLGRSFTKAFVAL